MQPPQPPYGQPPPGPGGYGPPPGPPGWGPPPGPPGRPPSNNTAAIVIAVIAGVLVVVGALTGAYFVFGGGDPPRRHIAVPTFTPPTYSPYSPYTPYTPPTYSPSPTYSPPSTYTPAWTPGVGDCVHNTGTYHKPILHKSHCTSGNYRVLRRYNGTTNINLCASTGRTWYGVWYTSPRFVICLRRL